MLLLRIIINKTTLFLLCLSIVAFKVKAQTKITEGILVYNITIYREKPEMNAGTTLTENQSGILTLYIKNENIRQDISLGNGYAYSRIVNYVHKKEIILQNINTLKYAIETNLNDLQKKNMKFRSAILHTDTQSRNINGFNVVSATLTYKDGSGFSFSYSEDYELIHPEIFERMPELKGIPVSFTLPALNGFITHFELQRITPVLVANTIFRIPEGYRIISKKEYDKLMK